jgi:hypothetical protein
MAATWPFFLRWPCSLKVPYILFQDVVHTVSFYISMILDVTQSTKMAVIAGAYGQSETVKLHSTRNHFHMAGSTDPVRHALTQMSCAGTVFLLI